MCVCVCAVCGVPYVVCRREDSGVGEAVDVVCRMWCAVCVVCRIWGVFVFGVPHVWCTVYVVCPDVVEVMWR